KELVKLAEKSAHEREKLESKKREAANAAAAAAVTTTAAATTTTTTVNVSSSNQIKVKPIIETVSPDPKSKESRGSYIAAA
ncbi:unnamed protein product, partial [Rotaria magnacalcarata]